MEKYEKRIQYAENLKKPKKKSKSINTKTKPKEKPKKETNEK